jgi:hypothetical protein
MTVTRVRSVGGLGAWVDGWADTVEGAAKQEMPVNIAFRDGMESRRIAFASDDGTQLSTGFFGNRKRDTQVVSTSCGANLVIHIAPVGRDLYLSWDLFVHQLWNWTTVWVILGLSVLFSFVPVPILGGYGMSLLNPIGIVTNFIILGILVGLLGLILRGNPLAFFLRDPDYFDAQDITAVTIAVDKTLRQAADSAGIDASLLRPKEQFRGGKRDRLI